MRLRKVEKGNRGRTHFSSVHVAQTNECRTDKRTQCDKTNSMRHELDKKYCKIKLGMIESETRREKWFIQ